MKAKPTLFRVADTKIEDLHIEVIAIDFSDAWTDEGGELRQDIYCLPEFTAVNDDYTVDYMGPSSRRLCDDYGAQFNES